MQRIRYRPPRRKAAYEALMDRCAFSEDELVEMPVEGVPELVATIPGMLKMLYHAEAARIPDARLRALVERFQRLARGVVSKEAVRASPRPLGHVLHELVGGEDATRAILPGPGRYSFQLVIEQLLAPKLRALSP